MTQQQPIILHTNHGGDPIHEDDLPRIILDALIAAKLPDDPDQPEPYDFEPADLDVADWPHTLKLNLMYQAQTCWHPADDYAASYWSPHRTQQARGLFADHPELLGLFSGDGTITFSNSDTAQPA